jgi:hypothetical protein
MIGLMASAKFQRIAAGPLAANGDQAEMICANRRRSIHHEPVEDGHVTANDFSAFTFANAVRLWGTQNPRFFEGTRVAKKAAAVRAAAPTPTLAAAE